MEQLPLRVRPHDFARFASFVPGRNVEICDLLVRSDGPRVMWLWGRAGCGKSHLLQAACSAAGERGEPALYLDLAHAPPGTMLDGSEALALVCLDGVENIAQAVDWNAAIFRTYLALQETRGRLVIASTAPPASLDFQLPDLRSRLFAASVHQVLELDERGQREALRLRAAARGMDLSDEAAAYLVHRLPRDMHSLFAVLERLDVASLAAQRKLTIPFLREQLEKEVSSG
jgi:DnaA family protein